MQELQQALKERTKMQARMCKLTASLNAAGTQLHLTSEALQRAEQELDGKASREHLLVESLVDADGERRRLARKLAAAVAEVRQLRTSRALLEERVRWAGERCAAGGRGGAAGAVASEGQAEGVGAESAGCGDST